jgi:arylsulfatase A
MIRWPRALLLLLALGWLERAILSAPAAEPRPNIVVILCDNLGNGDVACFNPGTKHRTPNLDRMAAEGRKLTSFYSASGVCTPSRAALLTGCYPRRIGLHISATGASVLQPVASRGIHPAEETLAELLKRAGYLTACIGKWHLGDQPQFLPIRHGFDSFLGIPYSEDMTRRTVPGGDWPELPLLRGERVVEAPVDVQHLTRRLTEEAVNFIKANKDRPFFLYFPEAAPGSRAECYPGPAFRGKSANGLYGDAIEELDWSAGEILGALRQNAVDRSTLVIWTSDNGAVQRTPAQGSNAPYKGMGYGTSEGGQRMPCIVRWPGKVPAGTASDEVCTMMDLVPTLVRLAGAPGPARKIDGFDISPILLGAPRAVSPYDTCGFFYYQMGQLQAVRAGAWKLYLPLPDMIARGAARKQAVPQTLALFDVRHDVSEKTEASVLNPGIVERLAALAESARVELGDGDRRGSGQRDAGHAENPRPLLLNP